jgi:hypothetical protein
MTPEQKRKRTRGRRALQGGAPRMFGRHDGASGRWYQEHYRALLQRFGPFDALVRSYAAGAAVLWVEFQKATRALKTAEETRMKGKGRRPNAGAVERLKRRQGLSWQSYDQSIRRLEELTSGRRSAPGDPLAAVRRAVEEANGR